jgi:hypothetical protein
MGQILQEVLRAAYLNPEDTAEIRIFALKP